MSRAFDHAAYWSNREGGAGPLLRLLDELYRANDGRSFGPAGQENRLEMLIEMLGPAQVDPHVAQGVSDLRLALRQRRGLGVRDEVASLAVMISIAALERYLSQKLPRVLLGEGWEPERLEPQDSGDNGRVGEL